MAQVSRAPVDWSGYDRQDVREPFDALLAAKESVKEADRERYGQEARVQAYLRMVKMKAGSAKSPRGWLLDFAGRNPPPDAAYCRARLGGEIGPLLRWHYCLALYFAEKGDWLARAVPLILGSAGRVGGGGARSASYLLLAHNLNRWYNCGVDGEVLESALRHIRERRDDAHAHWCAKIVEDLKARPGVRDEVRDILMEIAGGAKPGTAPQYLEGAVSVAHDKAPAKEAWVKFHEEYADAAQDPLRKIIHYNDAKLHLDEKEGQRRINEKIKNAQKLVEMNQITHRWSIPNMDIPGGNGYERVRYLVDLLRRSIPSVEAERMRDEELRERFPIQHLFARIDMGDDGVPGPRPGTADADAAGHAKGFANTARLLRAILSASVREYEGDGRIAAKGYEEYMGLFGLHTDAAERLVGAGIAAHLAGDYVASVHILIPQLEQALRLLLEQKGAKMLGGRDRVRHGLLKSMIRDGDRILGHDLAEFLRIWLVDEGSTNLRNRVCHALYAEYPNMKDYDPLSEFEHGTSLLLVLLICLLATISTDPNRTFGEG